MLSLENNLMGKVLIASPVLSTRSYFSRTVIYVLRNSIEGSVGVIVNQPLTEFEGNVVVKHEKQDIPLKSTKAYAGGPMEIEKGFILQFDKKVKLGTDPLIKLSSNISSLKTMAKRRTSKDSLFIFGYCGWASGQLEEEIINNDWLVAPANKKIIFEEENKNKWGKYLDLINVNMIQYIDHSGSC
ncbi:MAG: YqgE/AlgH family protein [Rickettsiales bacterium]|nr:YqgE/AlgH family protein [Rickettsiales bacterium]